ncbi:MAG: hypothetical protein ABIH69_07580 [bacterium]
MEVEIIDFSVFYDKILDIGNAPIPRMRLNVQKESYLRRGAN